MEEYSKLNDSIYWHDGHGVFVNLFIPSELDWQEKGFKLRQETKFPEQQGTSLVVSSDKPVQLAMRLRIPAWLDSAPTVKINGRPIEASADPGSYLTISRTWKKGDRVEMALPMSLKVEAMPDDPKTQAFLYGPLVLAGDLGSEGLNERLIIGPSAPRISRGGIPGPARCSAAGAAHRDPHVPRRRRRSGFLDQARRQAADLPDVGTAEGCDARADQQHLRQEVLGLLAGFVALQGTPPRRHYHGEEIQHETHRYLLSPPSRHPPYLLKRPNCNSAALISMTTCPFTWSTARTASKRNI